MLYPAELRGHFAFDIPTTLNDPLYRRSRFPI